MSLLPDSENRAPLHFSQKLFWFTTSLCMIAVTAVFVLGALDGRESKLEMLGISMSSAAAGKSVAETRERLLAFRGAMIAALDKNDTDQATEELGELENVFTAIPQERRKLK